MKTQVNLTIEAEVYKKARDIIQNKMGITISGFVEKIFIELNTENE